MTKKYKVDKSKIIGNVIFVVEGGRPETGGTELRLLKRFFSDVLGYEVQAGSCAALRPSGSW